MEKNRPASVAQAVRPPDGALSAAVGRLAEAARSAGSETSFWREALAILGRTVGSPCALLSIRRASSAVEELYHSGMTDPGFWKPALQRFLTDSLAEGRVRAKRLNPKKPGTQAAFLFAPLRGVDETVIGGLALVCTAGESEQTAARLTELEVLTRVSSLLAPTSEPGEDRHGASPQSAGQALSKASGFGTPTELAFSLTNSLRSRLDCELVALATVCGPRVRILSISGFDDVATRSAGVAQLRGAMEECLDAGQPVLCPHEADWSSAGPAPRHRLHRQWQGSAQGAAVASIPLRADGKTAAVLSLRRQADRPFSSEQLAEVRTRVEAYLPALELIGRASRGVPRHVWDAARSFGRRLVAAREGRLRVTVAMAVAAAMGFFFGRMDYRLTVPCEVAAAEVRHVTAPFDGVLAAQFAMEGQRVVAGEKLCLLDHRELDQQRQEIAAEWAVLERERDRAAAENRPVDGQLALARQKLLEARLASADRRIEQATVRSPIDGVLVSGDLRKSVGTVVPRGSPLFEVAPLDRWTIELYVPEADGDDVVLGQRGFFAAQARPEESCRFELSRIRPRAESRESKTVFLGEAALESPFVWLRPGMEGTAKIEVGRRAVWWVLLHRAIDYLRITLWI